jgi:hypothetical protein
MAVSGSRNFILTRNEIITQAARNAGVLAKGETISADDVAELAIALNVMVNSWQNENIFLWANTDAAGAITADTAYITLSSSPDILEVSNVYFRSNATDTPLKLMTLEEYKALSKKATAGDPTHYFVDYLLASTVLYLYPVPENTTSVRTGSDSNTYVCLNDHTSAAATYPITGASYTSYWEATSLLTTGGAWVTGTDYYSDHIRYTKTYRLQDFDASTDNPDAPTRWYQALIDGLTVECMKLNGMVSGKDFDKFKAIADYSRLIAMNSTKEGGSVRIQPRVR